MTRLAAVCLTVSLTACMMSSPDESTAQARSLVTSNRMVLGSTEDLTAGIVFADVDGDGDADIVFANGRHWAQTNEVYLNNGSGLFSVGYPLGPEKATTYAVPTGDLDGDGDLDVVVVNDRAPNWVYLNDGTGRFTLAWQVGPQVEPARSARLDDLNGDGTLDLLVTNRGAANGFYLNDGTGHFAPKQTFGDPDGSTIDVAVGDVDGDGDADLVLANRDGQANQILLNDGALGFDDVRTFGTGSDETRSAALADVNGDGRLDIAVANIGEPNAVYLGRGDGTFDEGTTFGADENSYMLEIVDLDRDGDLDLVVANVNGPNIAYLNGGDGRAWTEMRFDDGTESSYGVATADLNGDGFPEVGFANSGAFNRLFQNRPGG